MLFEGTNIYYSPNTIFFFSSLTRGSSVAKPTNCPQCSKMRIARTRRITSNATVKLLKLTSIVPQHPASSNDKWMG